MTRLFMLLVLIFAVALPASTQFQHDHSSNIVDGAIHPDLIPDAAAYRLYFVAVSEMPNPSGEAKQRQLSHLGRIGLQAEDLQVLIPILNSFKVRYSDLTAK